MSKNYAIIFFVSVLFVSFTLTSSEPKHSSSSLNNSKSIKQPYPFPSPNYTTSMSIIGDEDFDNWGFPGNGTSTDPYIIENLVLSDPGTIGINIYGTTKHFIIRNCEIRTDLYGIRLYNVADNTAVIQGCVCIRINDEPYGYGILIQKSNNVTIRNNRCNDNIEGITVQDSSHVLIVNNTVTGNSDYGISVNGYGTQMINNTIGSNRLLIDLDTYRDYDSLTLSGNKINGLPLYYFKGLQDDIVVLENSETIFFDCRNITIRDSIISYTYSSISLVFCSNCYVVNNTLHETQDGILIKNSVGCEIRNNTCENIPSSGIHVISSSHCLIQNNTCLQNVNGITFEYSSFSNCLNNNCTNNEFNGFNILYSPSNNFENCFAITNGNFGLYHEYSDYSIITNNNISLNANSGIFANQCYNLNVEANILNANYQGVEGYFLKNSDIIFNLIENNTKYGVKLSNGDGVNIHHNRFISNNQGGESQAYDSSDNNLWFDPNAKMGNYWNEHNSSDPYLINSIHYEVYDRYPLDSNLYRENKSRTALVLSIVLPSVLLASLIWLLPKRFKKRKQM